MKKFLVLILIFGTTIASPEAAKKSDERVIGATNNVILGQLPWMAGIMYNRFFICSGALISPRWVITSAECVDSYSSSASFLSVQLGNLESNFAATTDYKVQFIVIHPDYTKSVRNKIMHHRNIALLRLTADVVEDMIVHHIVLPTIGQIPIGDHSDVSLAGWGLTWGLLGKDLQEVDLQTMTIDACINAVGGNPSIEHDYNVCTAGYSSTSGLPSGACEKDHGAPLIWIYALKPLLVGVVSQGDCMTPAARIPTIYTSTFGHNREWINMVTGI